MRPRLGREYLIALAAAVLLYGLTVAPGALWQDNGLAQVRVVQHDLRGDLGLALSHPLYYVLAIGFQCLPWQESAFKTNLVAAAFGAITVANVFLLLRLLTQRRWAAVVGAGSLAVAHTFWQHCALAEVYTVSTALLVAELLCLAQHARTSATRWLVLLCLANGLGVSNHLLAVLNLPVWGTLLLVLVVRGKVTAGGLTLCVLAWLGGAALYIALVAGESFGGRPLGAVLHSALFGEAYARNVLNMQLGPRLLVRSILYLGLNFPTPAALLALLGAAFLRRFRPRYVALSLAALLAIHLVWAVRYDVPDQYTFFIPAVVLISILIGIGADCFLQRRRGVWPRLLFATALLPPLVYAPLPWLARSAGLTLGVRRALPYRDTYTYFLWPWKTGYQGARRFATEVEQVLPEGSVLLADDTSARPIHYRMLTGQWRKQIAVWPPPPSERAAPGVLWPSASELAESLAAGRVFVVTPVPGYCPSWVMERYATEPAGIIARVVQPQATASGALQKD